MPVKPQIGQGQPGAGNGVGTIQTAPGAHGPGEVPDPIGLKPAVAGKPVEGGTRAFDRDASQRDAGSLETMSLFGPEAIQQGVTRWRFQAADGRKSQRQEKKGGEALDLAASQGGSKGCSATERQNPIAD